MSTRGAPPRTEEPLADSGVPGSTRNAHELPGGIFHGPDPRRPRHWWLRPWRRQEAFAEGPTAFVFAGGGSRGAAQVGMLQVLVERGIAADVVYGASAGAMNAAAYAGEPNAEGVERLASVWRGLKREDVFPGGRIATPWRFVQQRESVHPADGLRKIVQEGLLFERIEDARVPLEVVATSLVDGRVQWFDSGPALERILASAALPALLPPATIGGERFIDGGVVDNVPLDRALEQGAKRVFVLLCGPLRYRPAPYRRPVEAILTAFFIAIHAGFARCLATLPPGVEVIVIDVDGQPGSSYDDFSGTEELILNGRRNAEIVLDAWEESKASRTRER